LVDNNVHGQGRVTSPGIVVVRVRGARCRWRIIVSETGVVEIPLVNVILLREAAMNPGAAPAISMLAYMMVLLEIKGIRISGDTINISVKR
jgi:hypothetical protein